MVILGQAADTFVGEGGLQLALRVQSLRGPREGDISTQIVDEQIIRYLHHRLIENEVATVPDSLFEQKTNIQPQNTITSLVQIRYSLVWDNSGSCWHYSTP